jgi:hypothetical protein
MRYFLIRYLGKSKERYANDAAYNIGHKESTQGMDTSERESYEEGDTEISSADPCWYDEFCTRICRMVIPEEVNNHREWKSKITQEES